jgi:hypothetical protein
MITQDYIIDGKPYRMLTLEIKGEMTNVATHSLNEKINEMVEQERYNEIDYIDKMYGYYLPEEVDETDEREVRESIEDVMDY